MAAAVSYAEWPMLLASLGAPFLVAVLSRQATQMLTNNPAGNYFSTEYYRKIRLRTKFPDAVFGIAWLILLGVLGVAQFLVWRTAQDADPYWNAAMWLWIAQLGLFAIWTPVFIGLQMPILGLVIVLLFLGAALATGSIVRLFDIGAMVLYFVVAAWLLIATVLNTIAVMVTWNLCNCGVSEDELQYAVLTGTNGTAKSGGRRGVPTMMSAGMPDASARRRPTVNPLNNY